MRRSIVGVVLAGTVGVAAACGGSGFHSTHASPSPSAVVNAVAGLTSATKSADLSVTLTKGSLSVSSSGPVDFSTDATEQHVTFVGLPTSLVAQVPVPLTVLWVGSKTWLEATGPLAADASGKEWVPLTSPLAAGIRSALGPDISAGLSDVVVLAAQTTPIRLLTLLTTSQDVVTDLGASTADGGPADQYHVVVDTSDAVRRAANGLRPVLEGLAPKTPEDLWIDGAGRLRQLQMEILSDGTPLAVTVQLANFGHGVQEVAPSPAQIGTFGAGATATPATSSPSPAQG